MTSSEPRSDTDLRKQLADVYARRHAPGGEWQTIEDVAPQELVDIIYADSDAIIAEVIGPLSARVSELTAENERLRLSIESWRDNASMERNKATAMTGSANRALDRMREAEAERDAAVARAESLVQIVKAETAFLDGRSDTPSIWRMARRLRDAALAAAAVPPQEAEDVH